MECLLNGKYNLLRIFIDIAATIFIDKLFPQIRFLSNPGCSLLRLVLDVSYLYSSLRLFRIQRPE